VVSSRAGADPGSPRRSEAGTLRAVSERLDRVQIQLASEPRPLVISWDARERLLSRLRGEHGPLDDAFRAVGVARPVALDAADKEALLLVIDEWGAELGATGSYPRDSLR
jgi:hypothetical protein